jgi:AcrR family transcriptional regulator
VQDQKFRIDEIDGVIPANQARSRDAQARLLKAGEQVFARKGYDEAHVTDIAAAAGCSIGSFYRRFRDKEALFRALSIQFAARTRENFDRFFAMPQCRVAAPGEVIEVLVQNTARRIERHPGFFRALFQRVLAGAGQHYRPALVAADEYSGRRLAQYIRDSGEQAGPDLDQNCIMGLRTIQAALIHRMLLDYSPNYRTPPEAVGGLTRMLALFVGVTAV